MVAEARALGYPTRVIEAGRLRQFARYARTVRALRRWMDETRPDAVLSWMAKAHLYASPAAGGLGIPRFWYQHGIPSGGWLDRLVTRLPAAGILACSQAAVTTQQRLRPTRPTRVVYPAVEAGQAISQEAARQALGLPPGSRVVLLVSRLERWKGVDVAVEAAAQLLPRRPQTLFVHAGGRQRRDHVYADALQLRAAQLGDRWRFLGHVSPEELAAWYRAADLFVHPNCGPEPFGMAVVEAMAAGLPVVASGLGGPTEVITDGVDGVLVPPGDPAALARAISDLLGDSAERARLGNAAQARAVAFSVDAYPERLMQALVALVPSLLGTSGCPGESGSRPEPTA